MLFNDNIRGEYAPPGDENINKIVAGEEVKVRNMVNGTLKKKIYEFDAQNYQRYQRDSEMKMLCSIEKKLIRLQVLLTTSKGRTFSDMILDIDKKLVEKFGVYEGTVLIQEFLKKYLEIVEIAEQSADSIKQEFYGMDSNVHFSQQKYIQEILTKANDILEDFSSILDQECSPEVIKEHLKACNAEMIQYSSLFRVSEKQFGRSVSLVDSLKELGIDLIEKTGPEMNEDDKTAILGLYETNYQSHPHKEDYLANTKRVLEGNYQNPKAKFYLLRFRGMPLLSAKFIEKEDGSFYFGAFNTALYFQENQLGILVLEKLLENYADTVIRGHVIQDRKSLIRYYGRYGFEIEKDKNGNPLKPDIVSGIEFCRMIGYPKKKTLTERDKKV